MGPNNADAYASLGFLAAERGQPDEAERLLRKALTIDPKNYPATYDLGRILVRTRRYDEAISTLERGVKLAGDDPGVHYQLFLAYSRMQRKDDANRELELFKQLEEARKKREQNGTTDNVPLPVDASTQRSRPGVDKSKP